MNVLQLFISVPVASFRVAQAREYWETYPCPAPSTVYGMLLSLVGEPDRLVHQGAEIALALLSRPQLSVVLRTLWRVKNIKHGLGLDQNKRPDFQELLTNISLSVWVRRGEKENASPPIIQRLESAFQEPSGVRRFGGLSLGESTHLVDEVRPWRASDPAEGCLLVGDDRGDLSLPVWPDHVGSRLTRWGQFRLMEAADLGKEPAHEAWVIISPPGNSK